MKVIWLVLVAACGSKDDGKRDRERKALDLAYTELDRYEACLAGTKDGPDDLFVALAFKDLVPLPSSCPPPTSAGVEPPDLVETTHIEGMRRACDFITRAYAHLGDVAKSLGVDRGHGPRCAPSPPDIEWVTSLGDRHGRVAVSGDVAYIEGGTGRDSWVAYSTDGASWTTHAFESSPLSFRVRGDTIAALVYGGNQQQLYVGTGTKVEARPQRKAPSSVALVGESSIVLVGGNDAWQTATWSTDKGVTFGPDQKLAKPEYPIARRVVLGDGDAVIAASADDKQPILVIDRAERGQPTKQVARFEYDDPDYHAAINVCQAAHTMWVVAGGRQVAVSLDGGITWTALPPVTLAEDDAVLHDVAVTCTADALGIRTNKEVALCSAKACSAPLAIPTSAASYLRLAPKAELWSLSEGGAGQERLVTVHMVGAKLVPTRAYFMAWAKVPLIYTDGGWVELDERLVP